MPIRPRTRRIADRRWRIAPPRHLLSSILYSLALFVALSLSACDGGGPEDDPTDTFDRAAMLTHVGNELILPAYQDLAQSVDDLRAATDAFAADPTEATLAAAQQALKTVRLAWQEAAPYQFGPAESAALRAQLNTYPVDVARVEANVASGAYTLGGIADRAAGGLPALGYLLHGGASPAETLAQYTTAADAAGRTAYLQANVDFVETNVEAVVEAWRASGGDYIGTFLSDAKAGVDVGSSTGELVNALVRHYERFLRDGKLGIPAGVRSAGVPRPSATEAYYGGYSLDLARAGLEAVERLYLGTAPDGVEGLGFDDYLLALDAGDLAGDLRTAFAAARASVDALSDPLATQVETDNDAVLSAFSAMQQLVVLLKADLTSVLGVTITFQDNDGD